MIRHLLYTYSVFVVRDYFTTWDGYTVPLINATITAGLLDFIDFHAYDTDATALVSAIFIDMPKIYSR